MPTKILINNSLSFSTGHVGLFLYGFNGKEKSNEISEGDLDFGARIYDSKIGRWLSVDALSGKFPDLSPYNFCVNNPILFVDIDGNEPTKLNSVGLSAYIASLRTANVLTLSDLLNTQGGHPYVFGDASWSSQRYLYSPKWGWIDMRHFAAAALRTDNPLFTGEGTLVAMEEHEKESEKTEPSSAWDYEDLTSNLLGVYFETYLESDEAKDKDLATNIHDYLQQLGFVEDPTHLAPNYGSLPEDNNSEVEGKHSTYEPKYTYKNSKSWYNDLDNDVKAYLDQYMDGKCEDRSSENSEN